MFQSVSWFCFVFCAHSIQGKMMAVLIKLLIKIVVTELPFLICDKKQFRVWLHILQVQTLVCKAQSAKYNSKKCVSILLCVYRLKSFISRLTLNKPPRMRNKLFHKPMQAQNASKSRSQSSQIPLITINNTGRHKLIHIFPFASQLLIYL